jgi:hypothetical protein
MNVAGRYNIGHNRGRRKRKRKREKDEIVTVLPHVWMHVNAFLCVFEAKTGCYRICQGLFSPTAWDGLVLLQWSRYMRGGCLLEAGSRVMSGT